MVPQAFVLAPNACSTNVPDSSCVLSFPSIENEFVCSEGAAHRKRMVISRPLEKIAVGTASIRGARAPRIEEVVTVLFRGGEKFRKRSRWATPSLHTISTSTLGKRNSLTVGSLLLHVISNSPFLVMENRINAILTLQRRINAVLTPY